MTSDNFGFLAKIPDQTGYLVLSTVDGAIVKSEGELANRDAFAKVVERFVSLSRSQVLDAKAKVNLVTVAFSDHAYSISHSGKFVFVVKKKIAPRV